MGVSSMFIKGRRQRGTVIFRWRTGVALPVVLVLSGCGECEFFGRVPCGPLAVAGVIAAPVLLPVMIADQIETAGGAQPRPEPDSRDRD